MNTKTVTLFRSGTQTFNFYRSLRYAHSNKSIRFFIALCKPIKIYTKCTAETNKQTSMLEKAPGYNLSRSKAPKTQ